MDCEYCGGTGDSCGCGVCDGTCMMCDGTGKIA